MLKESHSAIKFNLLVRVGISKGQKQRDNAGGGGRARDRGLLFLPQPFQEGGRPILL